MLLGAGVLSGALPAAGFEPEPGTFEPGPTRFRTPPPRTAPEPREVVRACKEKLFVDCFRLWQPLDVPEPLETPKPPKPPTPPRPPQRQAVPLDPNAPKPPRGDDDDDDVDLTHPDQATYDALRDALGRVGLGETVKLGPLAPGPIEGSTDLTVTTPKPAGSPVRGRNQGASGQGASGNPKPAAGKAPPERKRSTAPIPLTPPKGTPSSPVPGR